MTTPSEFEKKVKSIMLILAILLPMISEICYEWIAKGTEYAWLSKFAVICSIVGTAIFVITREGSVKGKMSEDKSKTAIVEEKKVAKKAKRDIAMEELPKVEVKVEKDGKKSEESDV
jgi:hypothetical protein